MKGFTLIELLAVIIILAVVALIATPVVLNVVNDAKESARKSQLSLYADNIKTQLTGSYLANGGKYSKTIDLDDDNLDKAVTCEEVHYTKDSKVLLGNCTIKGSNENYWYMNGEISTEKPDNFEYLKYALLSSTETVLYSDNSGANKPILVDKMIPVIYKDNNWVYVDITEKWYDYDNQEWANAVVLNDDITKNVGDTIDVDTEVALMFVWIPRYKYTIFNGNNESVPEQEIKISFENGTNSTGTVTCNDALNQTDSSDNLISEICTDSSNGSIINQTSTYTHPAFCLGHRTDGICDGDELTGIWVGKFENSTTDTDCNTNQNADYCNTELPVTIKPNVRSWRYAQVANFYMSIDNISSNYGMNVDSHMMKNMEWGAVAYLTQSKYGRCDNGICVEVGINNNSSYTTGCGASSGSSSSNSCNAYNTITGMLASTTGNTYGIYDMSGGAWEYVMGNMADSDNEFYNFNAGFSTEPFNKYFDSYTYSTSNTTHSRGRLGDATKETLKTYGNISGGWYGDSAIFSNTTNMWFRRGSSYGDSTNSGVFSFGSKDGSVGAYRSSRSVISFK